MPLNLQQGESMADAEIKRLEAIIGKLEAENAGLKQRIASLLAYVKDNSEDPRP